MQRLILMMLCAVSAMKAFAQTPDDGLVRHPPPSTIQAIPSSANVPDSPELAQLLLYENFENAKIPTDVERALTDAQGAMSFGVPRFKHLAFSYVQPLKTQAGTSDLKFEVELTAESNLVRENDYLTIPGLPRVGSSSLTGMGGLVTLKMRALASSGDRLVRVAMHLEITPLTALETGSSLVITEETTPISGGTVLKPTRARTSCEVSDSFEARKVFSSLTGRAFGMRCVTVPDGRPEIVSYRTYLEDLGIVIKSVKTQNSNASVASYLSFDVQK